MAYIITLQQERQHSLGINQLINPKEKRTEQEGSKLFDTIVKTWYADHKTFLASSTFNSNYSAYTRDVKSVIGHKLIDNITPNDILTIGKNVESRGANETARRITAEVG